MEMYTVTDEKGRKYLQTGDPIFDQWEKDWAEGRTPDLWAGFSEKQREKIKRTLSKRKTVKEAVLGTQSQYDDVSNINERYG